MIEPQGDGALPTLSQIGVDSLVGIEIQNWWRTMFGVDVTLLQLLEADSFQKLGELAVRQLDELTRGERGLPDGTTGDKQSRALDVRDEHHEAASHTKVHDETSPGPYFDIFRKGLYCLCRSADAAGRQIHGFQLRGLEVPRNFKDRVEYICVDLPAPNLGIPDIKYEELRLSVDIIIHCAWELSFSVALDTFERIHIRGLSRLLELAERCRYRPHIHFMSSLLALYAKESQALLSTAQDPSEKPVSAWPVGYTESKLMAEQMCMLASTNWGLPTTIHRIGQIAGSSGGQGVVWNRSEWFPLIMHSSKIIHKVPSSLGLAEINWMPVDQVAKAICEILQSRSSSDVLDSTATFNLVNPSVTRWESLLPVIQEQYQAEVVEPDTWLAEVEKHDSLTGSGAESIPTQRLLPLYRQGLELFNQGWIRPSYDTERSILASETLRNMGPITPQMMERWIQQWDF
ncbi:hypothetical protein AbraIFM66951_006623 [Aspergillus brasiliensis]|nr:hypothetical protein AbraIFM66951_006623 [Aspergillus brasiliensis]